MPSFDQLYDRPEPAYGTTATPELTAILDQQLVRGRALDLGAGAGRDTVAMARHGFQVTAIDQSRRGIERLRGFATASGVDERIDAQVADVTECRWAAGRYELINAVTILDHLGPTAVEPVWWAMCQSLARGGLMHVQVHTVLDPGHRDSGDAAGARPSSESAGHVKHYFQPHELLEMAGRSLIVLRYEQRIESDRTHGRPHMHAKASLLASSGTTLRGFRGHPARPPLDGADPTDRQR